MNIFRDKYVEQQNANKDVNRNALIFFFNPNGNIIILVTIIAKYGYILIVDVGNDTDHTNCNNPEKATI